MHNPDSKLKLGKQNSHGEKEKKFTGFEQNVEPYALHQFCINI